MEIARTNKNSIVKYVPAAVGAAYQMGKSIVPYAPTIVDALGNVVSRATGRKKKNKGKGEQNQIVGGIGAIAAPVSITKRVRGMRPSFKQTKGKVHIVHRELVTSVINLVGNFRVNNNVSAQIGQFRINPSNSSLFTWLPTIASNFDSYRFTSIRFVYVPLCATTETGRVSLFWDKDSQDPLPVDRAALSSYGHSNEGPPWAETILNVPTDGKQRFVTDSNTTDRKLVDLGQFAFATYAGGSDNQIGDIYVEYGVEFSEAQPAGGLTQYITKSVGATASTTGPSYVVDANINVNATTANIEFFSPGTFLITAVVFGTTIASPSTAGGNGTVIGDRPVAGVANASIWTCVFSTTGVSTSVPTFTQAGTGLTRVQYTITRVNSQTAYQF